MFGSLFGWVVSKVTSGALSAFGNSVLTPVLKHLDAGTVANKDIAIAMVSAEVAANNAKAAMAPAFKGMIYGIGIPPAIHFGAMNLSVTFDLAWPVKDLPAAYVPIEAMILTAFFVSSP